MVEQLANGSTILLGSTSRYYAFSTSEVVLSFLRLQIGTHLTLQQFLGEIPASAGNLMLLTVLVASQKSGAAVLCGSILLVRE
jgi:hypothetical protein